MQVRTILGTPTSVYPSGATPDTTVVWAYEGQQQSSTFFALYPILTVAFSDQDPPAVYSVRFCNHKVVDLWPAESIQNDGD